MTKIEIGHIILSAKLSREEYIDRCSRTHTVNVITSDGSVLTECPIAMPLNSNETSGEYTNPIFPTEVKLGIPVILLFAEDTKKPVVAFSITTNENYVLLENEKQNKKIIESDECDISIVKDPINGKLNVSIIGKTIKGEMNLKVVSQNNDAELNIDVFGKANINGRDEINLSTQNSFNIKVRDLVTQENFAELKYLLGEGLTYIDEYDNKIVTNETGIIIETDSIRIGGDETVSKILKDLLTAIKNMQHTSPAGVTNPQKLPINWVSDFVPIINRIENFMEKQ